MVQQRTGGRVVNPDPNAPLLGISCRKASQLIAESLDRELTRRERWSLRLHTVLCSACREFARQSRWIREALANAPDALRDSWSEGTAKLSAEKRSEIKRLLTEARRAEARD
jgi:hypothetical protein